jgi:hypothetical protein
VGAYTDIFIRTEFIYEGRRFTTPAANNPDFAGRDVLLFSATPTPGRAYGLELLYRFGN